MRAHWRKEEWVLGLLYFWAGSCYTFFSACVTNRTNFLKCFAVRALANALNRKFLSSMWSATQFGWQGSISMGDIFTQPLLVCWKNVMEYEYTWGCLKESLKRPRKVRPVRRCFLSTFTLITCRSFIILNFIYARKASQIQVRKLCKI